MKKIKSAFMILIMGLAVLLSTGLSEAKNNLTIRLYDKTVNYTGDKTLVKDILNEMNIKIGENDVTVPDLNASVKEGDCISILKGEIKEEVLLEEVNYNVIKKKNDKMNSDWKKILVKGVKGDRRVFYKSYYVNSRLIKREAVKVELISPPKDEIVEVGTKDTIKTSRGSIRYKKVYKMIATAYEAGFQSTGKRPGDKYYGITATGTRAKIGTVAVDPRVIPLGTKLYVKSLDPNIPDYGFATAEDVGGAIKNMRIDLFMNTVKECYTFGKRPVMVYILEP